MVGQVARPPAYQVLADDLRAQITSGRLRPGQRLPAEPELCVRSGVSRSTVREALRLLASQHLIVTTRGVSGGSFVAHPNPEKLAETLCAGMDLLMTTAVVGIAQLIEVRRALELPAAALAADRRGEEHLSALREALFDPATASVDAMVAAHRGFHSTLATATGNPLYELVTRPLYRLQNGRELSAAAPPGYWVQIDRDHREILRCLAERDRAGAVAASAAHLDFIAEAYGCGQP